MTVTRVTAGMELGTSGVFVPDLHEFWWMVDDSWGYTTTPSGTIHAGIETKSMLNRLCAFRRYHVNFAMPNASGHFAGMEAVIPKAAQAVGLDPAPIPVLVQNSASSGTNAFPVYTTTDGKGHTAGSANTASVKGFKGLDRFTNGEFDTPYSNLFTAMKSAMKGQPWAWLWAQEQNIPAMNAYGGYQGGTDGTGQARYIAAYQHIGDILRSIDPLAILVQCWTEFDPDNNKTTYYAGDDYPDYLWTDNYRDGMARAQATHDFSVAHTKPFGMGESGFDAGVNVKCTDGVHRDKDGSVTGNSFIEEILTYVDDDANMPNLSLLTVWNYPGTSGHNNLIDTTAASLAQYKALANDSRVTVFFTTPSAPNPPVNIAPPTISPQAPDTTSILTADPGTYDTRPTSYSYRWRKRTSTGGTVSIVSGATSPTLGSLTAGNQYQVGVTPSNSAGAGAEVWSGWTNQVASAPANGATCNITSPVDGGQVAAGVTQAQAIATGPNGISGVVFILDGGSPITATGPGGNGNGLWTAPIDVEGSDGSTHTLKATATPVTS